jgi:hypothetical protein
MSNENSNEVAATMFERNIRFPDRAGVSEATLAAAMRALSDASNTRCEASHKLKRFFDATFPASTLRVALVQIAHEALGRFIASSENKDAMDEDAILEENDVCMATVCLETLALLDGKLMAEMKVERDGEGLTLPTAGSFSSSPMTGGDKPFVSLKSPDMDIFVKMETGEARDLAQKLIKSADLSEELAKTAGA